MPDKWLALRRVGEWAGLEGQELSEYLTAIRPIHNQRLRARKKQADIELKEGYFEFLNESVFCSPDLVSFLRQDTQLDDSVVKLFEDGRIPVADTFVEQSVMDYSLDEIADFVMLLKLFDGYRKRSGASAIRPLENFHSLVYLVNYRLSESESQSITDEHGFGMLEKTGYRYTFSRRNDYVWSESLQRDQDRLFAWQVLEREVVEEPKPEWELTYSVSLGEAAELFLTRFKKRLSEFDSLLLREWELQQESVLEDFANSSKAGLISHLESLDRFTECSEGAVVLNGRPKRFKSSENAQEVDVNV